jgi:hypothetical protein
MSSAEVTDTIMAEAPTAPSIREAAHQYQLAMSQEATPPNPTTDPPSSAMELSGDSVVNGNVSEAIEVYKLKIFASSSAYNQPSLPFMQLQQQRTRQVQCLQGRARLSDERTDLMCHHAQPLNILTLFPQCLLRRRRMAHLFDNI